jgi:hypothetical protein
MTRLLLFVYCFPDRVASAIIPINNPAACKFVMRITSTYTMG